MEGDVNARFKFLALNECTWKAGSLVSQGHWTFPITSILASNPNKRVERLRRFSDIRLLHKALQIYCPGA